MNLNYLRTFVLVVEKKSFSGAAKSLFLTQPAVTLQIQTLEENIGMQLLIRKGKSLLLTEAGEILYHRAKEILELWEETTGDIYRISKVVKGKIALGASSIPGEYLLPRIIADFSKTYPDVEIVLEISNTEDVMERTLIGELDLGFVGSFILHDRLEIARFAQDKIVLISSLDHPLAKKSSINFNQLTNQPIILRPEGSGTRKTVEKKLKEHGLAIKGMMELSTTEAVISAVENGAGLAFLSSIAAKQAAHRVKVLPIEDIEINRDFYLIFSPLKAKKAVVREFVNTVFKK